MSQSPFSGNWFEHPERLSRAQLVAALKCVDDLIGHYVEGEVDSYTNYTEVDATHDAVAANFEELRAIKRTERLAEHA